MRTFLLLIVILGTAACKKPFIEASTANHIPVPWNDTSTRHPKNAVFRNLLEKYQKRGLPGMSLLVSDPQGTWVGAVGHADLEHHIPFSVGQVSKAASITKLFMGALIFRLIEDSAHTNLGYRSLFQPITTWLPQRITDRLPNGREITLGDCLKHETGIKDVIDQDRFYLAVLNTPNKKWEAEELLQFVYDSDPLFRPGDTAIYSNTNTVIVSMIMEAATGRPHNNLLHQYLLTPLSLKNTFYQPHDDVPSTVAQGYYDLYDNHTVVNVSNLTTGSGNGYGGIFSNVFDLYTFLDALLLKKSLLSPRSLALMQTWGVPDGQNQYGYGIMKKFIGRSIDAGIGHSGRDVGYTCNLFYFPNKKVVHIFFVNYGTDGDSDLGDVFYEFQEELLNKTLE
jgi:D-alanyl-D-alanine carboxypeptidase